MPNSVFHICSDYARQSLYPRMLRAIAAPGLRQFVYVPVRTSKEMGVGQICDDPFIQFRYSHLLRRYHRLLFRTKIRNVLADVIERTPVIDYDIIHAHFLYSDGAVALKLHRELGLPYIVAVRNSDVNFFMRYRPDLFGIRNQIIRHASRVVFLSPAYANNFANKLPLELQKELRRKSMTVPNGVTSDWLDGCSPVVGQIEVSDKTLKLLYVGDFTANKNIERIVDALRILRIERPTTLTVVGGGSDHRGRIENLLVRHADHGVTYLGRISDSSRLKLIYRNSDILVMPSFRETFGMAYIEALSQGVPVVHSHGQGVDGYFASKTVAAAVDPAEPISIANGIRDLAGRLNQIRQVCRVEAMRFDWCRIGAIYRENYGLICQ